MGDGRILVAEHDGTHVIALEGDVRLTLCAAFDRHARRVLGDPDFLGLLIDLTHAEGLDSTTLGQLARLAIEVQQRHGVRPTVFCTHPDLLRLLDSMGFEDVVEIRRQPLDDSVDLEAVCPEEVEEKAVRKKVLEAHRTLMGMNARNRKAFKELVETLEQRR